MVDKFSHVQIKPFRRTLVSPDESKRKKEDGTKFAQNMMHENYVPKSIKSKHFFLGLLPVFRLSG